MQYIDNILDCEQRPASLSDNVSKLEAKLVDCSMALSDRMCKLFIDNIGVEFDTVTIGKILGSSSNQTNSSLQVVRKGKTNDLALSIRVGFRGKFLYTCTGNGRDKSLDVVGALFSGNTGLAVKRNQTICSEML